VDTKWLEDFVALVDHGNFTRAAESRYITQPAFSRRIKALEDWLGVELVDRNVYPLRLTPVGQEFIAPIQDLLGNIQGLRTNMRERARNGNRIVVATQHSLSVSFCPTWYANFRPFLRNNSIYIKANNLYECVDTFLAKQCDLLLCYVTPQITNQLSRADIEHLELGEEFLLPVCVADSRGSPVYGADGMRPTPVISFPAESFFGDLIRSECLPAASPSVTFNVVYETALGEGVRSLVMQGAGMGWIPGGLVRKELESGALVVIEELPRVRLKVMLHKFRSHAEKSIIDYWAHLKGSGHAALAS